MLRLVCLVGMTVGWLLQDFHLYAQPAFTLPSMFRDSMVLQRDQPIRIWGTAKSGTAIRVVWKTKKYRAIANKQGSWEVVLPPELAGGPHRLRVEAAGQQQTIDQILMGDVWFCSGQSNMVHTLRLHDIRYAAEIASAHYPTIRQFTVATQVAEAGPKQDVPEGHWLSAEGDAVRSFSVVAYFFARKLQQSENVPIGIIVSAVGGSSIQAWMSEQALQRFPPAYALYQQHQDSGWIATQQNRTESAARETGSHDEGLLESAPWYMSDQAWLGARTLQVPGFWKHQGLRELRGTVWYRRVIELDSNQQKQRARLLLGRIVDADRVYINGKEVGSTSYQYPQRRYWIPPQVWKVGRNELVVRITSFQADGLGGFVPDKPCALAFEGDTIDLSGRWQYRIGEVFPPGEPRTANSLNWYQRPGVLFDGMVSPWTRYAIRGMVWYQGESNVHEPASYKGYQEALIDDWRRHWSKPDLPFLYVQLPGFLDYTFQPVESNWAALREAQRQASSMPLTGLVSAIDLGEWNDIHPQEKQAVGERLAIKALSLVYGRKDGGASPMINRAILEPGKIVLHFDDVGAGWMLKDGGSIRGFAVAGSDRVFKWVKAIVVGDQIHLDVSGMNRPCFIRYAWADHPDVNLYNQAGFPAFPFEINVSPSCAD